MIRLICAVLFGATIAVQASAEPPNRTVVHADYADPALWLCRPDLKDNRCKVDLDATVIAASGKTSVERFVAADTPAVDCFFVYPTVSTDRGWLSDFAADRMEWDDVKLQFARFGAVCRTFAPIYRQFTLTGLRAANGGPQPEGARPLPGVGGGNDVLDAWRWYLAHENKGRGVVVIGHSQGAGILIGLLATEVDGKPIQEQLVSALILGSPNPFLVKLGMDVGGSLKTIPLCHAENQTGCAIVYSSFRDTNPPPVDSRFAKDSGGLQAACVNPAALKGGAGQPQSYFLTKGFLNGSGGTAQPPWATPSPDIKTPFVKTPGLVTTECFRRGGFNFLAMSVNADPKDPRTDTLAGEIIRPTGPDWSWGLHLIDVDLAMGDLVRIVGKQSKAYATTR